MREIDKNVIKIKILSCLIMNKTEDPSVPAAGIGYNYDKVKPKRARMGKDSELQRRKRFRDPKGLWGPKKCLGA